MNMLSKVNESMFNNIRLDHNNGLSYKEMKSKYRIREFNLIDILEAESFEDYKLTIIYKERKQPITNSISVVRVNRHRNLDSGKNSSF